MGDSGAVGALGRWRAWARRLAQETHALALAYRDPRTPWAARLVAACVVAYALSPIDLIPDPIPVLGALDDLLILPLGMALAVRLIPPAVLADARARAEQAAAEGLAGGRAAAAVIIALWLLLLALGVLFLPLGGLWLWRALGPGCP